VRTPHRLHISLVVTLAGTAIVAGCTSSSSGGDPGGRSSSSPGRSGDAAGASTAAAPRRPKGVFTMSFAGDVHFAGRVGDRLAANPKTVFGSAAAGLRRADLTMVNLETAITTGGQQQNKEFTFRAPPVALTALRDAGIDVATMANNHGADYGTAGLKDSLAASKAKHFPIVGIGANKRAAFAAYRTTLNGVKVAIFAADQVQDETTLSLFSAGPHKAGVANAYDPALIAKVRAAKKRGYVVVVYIHWGVELQTCPTSDQNTLAAALAHAGASAVIGAHAHVLQGAGWRSDGTYVAYGLGNYLWWRSFDNNQDDNGVLTLTFHRSRVTASHFAPSHLDDRGVPVRSTGAEKRRIDAEWNSDRQCTNLSAHPAK
jgi:poly-gamma-glutamate capsule biosynthesis protein CapA/YwtB (metallophosphatase superfamily)